MSLPNFQDLLKTIGHPWFGKSRWVRAAEYVPKDQPQDYDPDATTAEQMCRLLEAVYAALDGRTWVGNDRCCEYTESDKYLVIHSFLETYTDNGNRSLVVDLTHRFINKDRELISTLKEQLDNITVTTPTVVASRTQLEYKPIIPARDRFFSVPARLTPAVIDETTFDCPISQERIKDPVTAPDGTTYERTQLQHWYDRGMRTCPMNPDKPLTDPAQSPTNYLIKRLIEKSTLVASDIPPLHL